MSPKKRRQTASFMGESVRPVRRYFSKEAKSRLIREGRALDDDEGLPALSVYFRVKLPILVVVQCFLRRNQTNGHLRRATIASGFKGQVHADTLVQNIEASPHVLTHVLPQTRLACNEC